MSGTQTFTKGNIITRSSKHIISSTGTVSRTSGHVKGNLHERMLLLVQRHVFRDWGYQRVYANRYCFWKRDHCRRTYLQAHWQETIAILQIRQISAARSVNRTWAYTNSGIVFNSYSITFHFLPGDIDGGANTANFYVANNSSGNWTLPAIGTELQQARKPPG